uniref:jmjC domain-containing protein 8 isoform X2 n=1 Tax=Solea senegalensis TaxID=28829 RepID=UPI001CD843C8|nr:jmjC domain-containing protein 8 isoform X2 [Solea senegalensis]
MKKTTTDPKQSSDNCVVQKSQWNRLYSRGLKLAARGPRLSLQAISCGPPLSSVTWTRVCLCVCCESSHVSASVFRSLNSDVRLEDDGRCDVDVLDASSLSYQQFLERYAYSRPVVLRALTNNTNFRLLCSKWTLLQEYGGRTVRLSTANTYSYRKVDVSFQEYVDVFLKPQSTEVLGNDTLYFFGDNNMSEWQSLFQNYVSPPYVLPLTSAAYSFGIAGPGTGVPFHWHGPGFSEVIYGRKRWFLSPPDKEPHFHPNHTTLSWLRDIYPSLPEDEAPLDCTIRPGEVTSTVSSLLLSC